MEAIHDLQSTEQSQLLDIIDQLRRQNLDADINIPQIVVCGDTSSGKSSVLEAIGQIRFPVGHQAVTKFPTEIVLRHSPDTSMSVKIIPANDRSEEQKRLIREYKFESSTTDHRRLDRIVLEAEDFLESIEESSAEFWSDLLSAEVSGPSLPHLTLVDLPGLIHFSPTDGASVDEAEDGKRIQELTLDYLRNPRAVVLAVVSAINDTRNQEILSLVKRTNAQDRTLGIITKPDRVSSAEDERRSLLALARNEDIRLGLGWHVLRNLAHDEADTQRDERDEIERTFFQSAMWSDMPTEILGITPLRKKLSRCLFNCIKRDLPLLLEDMQSQFTRCSRALDQLGEGRESPQQQREYLSSTLQHLQRLVEAALEGQYSRSEFLTFFDGNGDKHLRDVMNVQSQDFANHLRESGKQYCIVVSDNSCRRYAKPCSATTALMLTQFRGAPASITNHAPLFVPPYVNGGSETRTHVINLETYCTALARHIRTRRGKHLKDHPSEAVIQDIFRQQSVRWDGIARSYETACFAAACDFVRMAVVHVVGQYTADSLFENHIDSELDRRGGLLRAKVSDLLWPYQAAHPVTYHPSLSARTCKGNMETFAHALEERDELLPAAQALDQAQAYYDVSLVRTASTMQPISAFQSLVEIVLITAVDRR